MEKMKKKIQAAKSAWKCAQNYCSNFGTFPEKKGEKHTHCAVVSTLVAALKHGIQKRGRKAHFNVMGKQERIEQ